MDRTSQVLGFVTTPTEIWLRESLQTCRSRLLVASPYVNDAFTQLLSEAPPTVKTTLVTKTDLRDFAIGSSNLGDSFLATYRHAITCLRTLDFVVGY